MWQRTKHTSKSGFDKLWGWADKLGAPVNRLSNKLGSEAFWPTTLDKESDKAARILRSFCKDGFYEEEVLSTLDGPQQKQKVLKKIPQDVIRNAVGLAIFTTMRSGLWVSGAGGSGVLVGRTADGSWSPPSGIMLHTAGLGFLVGVDIYDCVVVINTHEALDAFSKVRCTLGGEISAVAGPVGVGGVVESEVHKRQAPIFTYMKSRGFYAGIQVDGTVVIERTDENERFYGEQIGVADILAGNARHPPPEIRPLLETIRAAQGDADIDQTLLSTEPPPGDFEIDAGDQQFGVPDRMDPDPYGVLALEKVGLHIVEAGTGKRPTSEAFEFNPSPASPIYSTFSRRSTDRNSFRDSRTVSRRSSWRTSTISNMTDRATQTVDMGVQTDFDGPSANSQRASESESRSPMKEIPENDVAETSTAVQAALSRRSSNSAARSMKSIKEEAKEDSEEAQEEVEKKEEGKQGPETTEEKQVEANPKLQVEDEKPCQAGELSTGEVSEKTKTGASLSALDTNPVRFSTYDFENVAVEEPVVQQLRQAATPQAIRARLVTVKKPTPPRIPPRNPIRNRKGPLIINAQPHNDIHAHDSMSPRSPPSSSEHPSVSTMDSASTISSRDSFSSDDGITAMNKRISVMRMSDSDETEGRAEKKRNSSDSVPSSPGQVRRSAVEEDFS
ncbi:LAS seventeen-binding protein 3 [Lasiodiplodia hormozganensis]|uniref:LAS seventeen-binding protein 3 n=1 Tax=Lasiodiplodia hormozganensis TaxID=869390 RepID=A0AA39YJY6_9PEZI|nr:LAS seventeen-binding protein 3 [Lasiodiplodia hormozganensis]